MTQIIIDAFLDEMGEKYFGDLKTIVEQSLCDASNFINKKPSKIIVKIGTFSVPFANYDTDKNTITIYLSPLYIKPLYNKSRSIEDRNLALRYIFAHEILESLQQTPGDFKRFVNSIFSALQPSLEHSLNLEPTEEGLELLSRNAFNDLKTDNQLIKIDCQAEGALIAHTIEAGIFRYHLTKLEIYKEQDKFYTNIEPYDIAFFVISSARHKALTSKIIKKFPKFRGHIPKYTSQFSNRILGKLRYKELQGQALIILRELEKSNMNWETIYNASKVIVSKLKNQEN